MKPLQHAQISAHRYGGTWQDWIGLHGWVDRTKAFFPSMQHRMILHSDFGGRLAVLVLGETITAANGAAVHTSDLFADHQLEDLGRTVPLSEWLRETSHDLVTRRRRPPRNLEPVRESATEGLAARWGGLPRDYEALVSFFDMPAVMAPDYAEAASLVTHSSFGIFLAEELFGITLSLSETPRRPGAAPRFISTRSAAEDLVHARLGWIPSACQLPSHTRLRLWMRGTGVRGALRERLAGEKCRRQIHELLNSCSAGEGENSILRKTNQ